MQGRYKVITLCGSTRFKDEFIGVQKELTLKGYIVISVGLFGHHGDDEVWEDGVKEMLDDMHLSKIDMAIEVIPMCISFTFHFDVLHDFFAKSYKHASEKNDNQKLSLHTIGCHLRILNPTPEPPFEPI